MLIINADDWGHSAAETDAALRCYQAGRITSVSAMLFMADSERAAEVAKENQLDVGLHLNFSEPFATNDNLGRLNNHHGRIVRYLKGNKYAQLFYNPLLTSAFNFSYQAQVEEFVRLYGKQPSHVNGHHHMHLCANVLLSNMIPRGVRMRRNFSFWPGEKSFLNRAYRALADRWLARNYRLNDYFFDLTQCIEQNKFDRITSLARSHNVELMTHPIVQHEADYLMSDEFRVRLEGIGYQSSVRSLLAAASSLTSVANPSV